MTNLPNKKAFDHFLWSLYCYLTAEDLEARKKSTKRAPEDEPCPSIDQTQSAEIEERNE